MRYLGLDIGTRRTGMALLDDAAGVPVALDTLAHASVEELVAGVVEAAARKRADHLVLGLPLLPSGVEGEQAAFVREAARRLSECGLPCSFVDERYTTPRPESRHRRGRDKRGNAASQADPNASAACDILAGFRGI